MKNREALGVESGGLYPVLPVAPEGLFPRKGAGRGDRIRPVEVGPRAAGVADLCPGRPIRRGDSIHGIMGDQANPPDGEEGDREDRKRVREIACRPGKRPRKNGQPRGRFQKLCKGWRSARLSAQSDWHKVLQLRLNWKSVGPIRLQRKRRESSGTDDPVLVRAKARGSERRHVKTREAGKIGPRKIRGSRR